MEGTDNIILNLRIMEGTDNIIFIKEFCVRSSEVFVYYNLAV